MTQTALTKLAYHTHAETERLILRPLTLEDLPAYHEMTNDKEALKWDYGYHESFEESEEGFVRWILSNPIGKYGIVTKDDNTLIGNCSLRLSEDNAGEIGYMISREYWNNGYATEVANEMIRIGIEELGLEKIIGTVFEENVASQKVLNKIGMKHIETLPNQEFKGRLMTNLIFELQK
jgi:ribosomal-protein-alanine N-acetyltransferase